MKRYLLMIERPILSKNAVNVDGRPHFCVERQKTDFFEYDIKEKAEERCSFLSDLGIDYVLFDVYEGCALYDTRLPY